MVDHLLRSRLKFSFDKWPLLVRRSRRSDLGLQWDLRRTLAASEDMAGDIILISPAVSGSDNTVRWSNSCCPRVSYVLLFPQQVEFSPKHYFGPAGSLETPLQRTRTIQGQLSFRGRTLGLLPQNSSKREHLESACTSPSWILQYTDFCSGR